MQHGGCRGAEAIYRLNDGSLVPWSRKGKRRSIDLHLWMVSCGHRFSKQMSPYFVQKILAQIV